MYALEYLARTGERFFQAADQSWLLVNPGKPLAASRKLYRSRLEAAEAAASADILSGYVCVVKVEIGGS